MAMKDVPFCARVDEESGSIDETVSLAAWAAGGSMPETPKHTQVPQAQASLHSNQNQSHMQIKANKILAIIRRAEKQGHRLNLTCFCQNQCQYFRESFHLYDLSGKTSCFFS